MNLREKFFWNAVVTLSVIVVLWNAWGLYNQHQKSSSLLNKYNSDIKEVGADKELEIMVKKMEQNLSDRQNMKFLIKDNPVDLTKVINTFDCFLRLIVHKVINFKLNEHRSKN